MNEEKLGKALSDVLEGAAIVLLGTIIGRGAGLVTEILVIRLFSQSQYGIFRLGVLVTMLTGAVATLGFTSGVPRQIGFLEGNEEVRQIRETIGATYLLGGIASVGIGIIVFSLSEEIAAVFNTASLAPHLQLFALSIPFVVMVDLFVAVARGMGDSKPKLYIRTFVPKFGFLIGILYIGWSSLSFTSVIIAWIGSYVLAVLAAGIYGERFQDTFPLIPSFDISYNIVTFSLPLLIVFVINSIGSWVDTFVIGFYRPANVVGLYSATVLLTRLIPMILGSVSFLYLPIATRFYAEDSKESIQMIYTTVTKWITGLTLPIFISFMIFPHTILGAIFGPEFQSGATVMRLLALGFFTHTLLGTNGQSLVLLGRRRFFAASQIITVTLNLVLSLLLVPLIGIEGAAIGSAVAYTLNNIFLSTYLYMVSGLNVMVEAHIQPITWTMIFSSAVGVLLHGASPPFSSIIIFSAFIGILHTVVYIKTSSMNRAEREIIKKLTEYSGIPLISIVRRIE